MYALVPIVLVLFLSYKAVEYLLVTLFVPPVPPPQITQIPARLTADVWQTAPSAWLGVALAQKPRAPLAHYHQIGAWFEPDPVNDCTRSGCHAPLPHARHKETRAFLNMHATSLHCGVCHLVSETTPLPLVWYRLRDGRPGEAPALLQAYGWMLSDEGRTELAQPSAATQRRLVGLLRAATAQADGDPRLKALADHADGPRYTSDQFQLAVEHVRAHLPRHMRGEYGAKLALRDAATGKPMLGHPGTRELVRRFLAEGDTLAPEARAALLEKVHPLRRAETLQCHHCHRREDSLVDLSQVGYPPPRITALQQGWVFAMIEHIRSGQPFHMPGFLSPPAPAPAPGGRP